MTNYHFATVIDFQFLKTKFIELHNREPRLFRAPGRVNLIGEHVDYNDGFVLPMAINRECAAAIAPRADRQIRVHSLNLNESGEFDLDVVGERKKGSWLNFIEGVARLLERREFKLVGADILILSDVPSGAGLSSSAALEIAVGLGLTELAGQMIDRRTLAQIGQQTEHEFVGARIGIMDQFVSANAAKDHALLLDCRSLKFENVPLDTRETAVVICNTNVKHDLAASEYNTRRQECEQGVQILRQFLPEIKSLRDVSRANFELYADRLPEVVRRRCRHVVTEIERTLLAAEFLQKNDLPAFGQLMKESHQSLRDDYQVSCKELDTMAEIAENQPECLGARMTGGGFGGSTVNLVRRDNLDRFTETISTEYKTATNIEPDIYISDAAQGASEIN